MYSNESGFVPLSFEENMNLLLQAINTKYGTSMNYEQFQNTNYYAVAYPIIQQIILNHQSYTAIWEKLFTFFEKSNEKINNPLITYEAMINAFKEKGVAISYRPVLNPASSYQLIDTKLNDLITSGITISVEDAEAMQAAMSTIKKSAGNVYICTDLIPVLTPDSPPSYITPDGVAMTKQEVASIIFNHSDIGLVYQGDEEQTIILPNEQEWLIKWCLPVVSKKTLRLTITLSRNTPHFVESIGQIKNRLISNLRTMYQVGLDFEPEKYFEIIRDAPYASNILLEHKGADESDASYSAEVVRNDYNDKWEYGYYDSTSTWRLGVNEDNIIVA
jgi:hypothetical protein